MCQSKLHRMLNTISWIACPCPGLCNLQLSGPCPCNFKNYTPTPIRQNLRVLKKKERNLLRKFLEYREFPETFWNQNRCEKMISKISSSRFWVVFSKHKFTKHAKFQCSNQHNQKRPHSKWLNPYPWAISWAWLSYQYSQYLASRIRNIWSSKHAKCSWHCFSP